MRLVVRDMKTTREINDLTFTTSGKTFAFRPRDNPVGVHIGYLQALFTSVTVDGYTIGPLDEAMKADAIKRKRAEISAARAELDDDPPMPRTKRQKVRHDDERSKQTRVVERAEAELRQLEQDQNLQALMDTTTTGAIRLACVDNKEHVGSFWYLIGPDNQPIPDRAQQRQLSEEFLHVLDEEFAQYRYDIVDQSGVILRDLVRWSLFDLEWSGIDPTTANRRSDRGFGALNLNDAHLRNGDAYQFFARCVATIDRKEVSGLFTPAVFHDLFFDPNNEDEFVYRKDSRTWVRAAIGGAARRACYVWVKNDLVSGTLAGECVTGGVGGGAMRADPPDEREYLWTGSKWVGFALGLDLERHRSPTQIDARSFVECATPRQPKVRNPFQPKSKENEGVSVGVSGNMQSDIGYFKKRVDKFGSDPKDKKNLPKLTYASDLPQKKPTELFDCSLYVKKQKGDWTGKGGTTGQSVRRANVERDSAGAVMSETFQRMGASPNAFDLRSATAFARWVLSQNDKAAQDAWKVRSADVRGRDPKDSRADTERLTVRTDQEWCHLHGHGDGGREEAANFVSGSKHCNTEQLAIECGLRTRIADTRVRDPNLRIKVSAYLLPTRHGNRPYETLERSEIDFVQSFQLPPSSPFPDTLLQAAETSQQLAQILPRSSPKSADVLTQEAFRRLGPDEQKRHCLQVQERLRAIAFYPVPFGYVTRYKILYDGRKIFDHVFDAQKESFDYNEFKILQHTVRRVIAEAAGELAAYAEIIRSRVKKRCDGEKDAAKALPTDPDAKWLEVAKSHPMDVDEGNS